MQAPFSESRDRVHAMARLHDHLYRTPDVVRVAMEPYVAELVGELRAAYLSEVSIVVDAGEVQLHMEQAMPCGLILNELVTNALKHAFPDGWQGRGEPVIRVTVAVEGEHVLLRVQDNGIGLSDGAFTRNGSLGGSLVRMLTRQLDGELEVMGQGGASIAVRFPWCQPGLLSGCA